MNGERPRADGDGKSRKKPSASGHSSIEFLRQLELARRELLDVDVFEGQHPDRLHEAISAVDVPHPHVAHGDLEVEIAAGVLSFEFDLIRQIETAFGLDHIPELLSNITVFAEQREFGLALVVVQLVLVHPSHLTHSSARSRCPRPMVGTLTAYRTYIRFMDLLFSNKCSNMHAWPSF